MSAIADANPERSGQSTQASVHSAGSFVPDTLRAVAVRSHRSSDRCDPQPLVPVAIDLLAEASVDWSKLRNVEDLREELNL
ncbi:MAG: hypothetical protein HC895_00320 [Leptolyngbyaceae cyanobacterium SM1_3_5]|nr:hypothetical protein [Leptolyngbyaceae cyanobacterium SM1_3_5]